jgi:hypothetical protein
MQSFVVATIISFLTSRSTAQGSELLPNLQEGLLPPNGMWRGSTIDSTLKSWSGADPYSLWEDVWNLPLHIYRTFKAKSNAEITEEVPWIEAGGILFYSIQPKNWA